MPKDLMMCSIFCVRDGVVHDGVHDDAQCVSHVLHACDDDDVHVDDARMWQFLPLAPYHDDVMCVSDEHDGVHVLFCDAYILNFLLHKHIKQKLQPQLS